MATTPNKTGLSGPVKIIIGVGVVLILLGAGVLLSAKSQQSDPTLTAAPPPAPGAVPATYSPAQQALIAEKRANVKDLPHM